MSAQTWIELFGYLGSAIVLVSFLMTSVFKLRVVNTIGSLIFMTYALIIHSYPTAVMNLCLVLINLRFLWKMRKSGNEYELVSLDPADAYLKYLLAKQKEDIEKCFPGISYDLNEVDRSYLVTCHHAPAGIALGREEGDAMEILLDYSLPEYREFSIGGFLMDQLKAAGVKTLTYRGPVENHLAYLEKTGFEKVGDHYEKKL